MTSDHSIVNREILEFEAQTLKLCLASNRSPLKICSLICQDPILQQRDLKSICFISHAFGKEAQRLLSYRFPCLRDARRVKAWCLSLKRRPHCTGHPGPRIGLVATSGLPRERHLASYAGIADVCKLERISHTS